jgi:hypothetical protein
MESNAILIKERCYHAIIASISLDPDLVGESVDCLVGDVARSSITCSFLFYPAMEYSLTLMT